MDGEGLFGRGEAREDLVVNLLLGDQSDECRLEFARMLNPPVVVERLTAELAARSQ